MKFAACAAAMAEDAHDETTGPSSHLRRSRTECSDLALGGRRSLVRQAAEGLDADFAGFDAAARPHLPRRIHVIKLSARIIC